MGTRATDIDECLMPHPGEPAILKKYPSAFFGTNPHSLLTTLGVDTTLLVGNSTRRRVQAGAAHGAGTLIIAGIARFCRTPISPPRLTNCPASDHHSFNPDSNQRGISWPVLA